MAAAKLHWGKEMSYNNYLDVEAAYSAVCDFDEPTCVIVKVGTASCRTLHDASGLLGSFLWYRPGLCQCRFRYL